MNVLRNHVKGLLLIALSILASSSGAQTYPSKPIRVVVPFSPGGATDVITRTVMTSLSSRLGQSIVIENRAGANSILGLDVVAKAAPDGYTLGIAIPAYVINYTLYKTLPYTPKDLVAASMMYRSATLLVTGNPNIHNFADLKKEAAANGVTYASSGIGSMGHLKTEVLVRQAGLLPATHIPYRGSSSSWSDLISGRVLIAFDTYAVLEPQLKAGKLVPLVVVGNGQQRLPQLPDVPTATELGMPEVDTPSWAAVMAPAGTPPAVLQKLATELAAVLNSSEIRQKLLAGNVAPFPSSTPAEAQRFVAKEGEQLGTVVRQLGLEGSN